MPSPVAPPHYFDRRLLSNFHCKIWSKKKTTIKRDLYDFYGAARAILRLSDVYDAYVKNIETCVLRPIFFNLEFYYRVSMVFIVVHRDGRTPCFCWYTSISNGLNDMF